MSLSLFALRNTRGILTIIHQQHLFTTMNTPLPKKIFYVSIQQKYLDLIQKGMKTVEGRVNKNQYREIKKDDCIQFQTGSKRLLCRVISRIDYPSFRKMLEAEGVENCLPGIFTLSEGEKIYHTFPNYEKEAKKNGVVAFKIKQEE